MARKIDRAPVEGATREAHFKLARHHARLAKAAERRGDAVKVRVHRGIEEAHVNAGYAIPARGTAEGFEVVA